MADIYDEEDRRRALTQGLLGAGLAMLGARKGSEYNAFAQAGLLGLGGYGRSLENATEARDRKAQRDMQQQQYARQQQEWQRAQDERAAMQRAAGGAFTGGMPEMGPPTAQGEMQPGVMPQFNPQAYIGALQREGLPAQAIQATKDYGPKVVAPAAPKPENFTPASVAAFARSGDWNALVPVTKADASPIGKINPSDFTAASMATFISGGSKDYSQLVPIDKRSVSNVSVKNYAETEEQKAIGKARGELFSTLNASAQKAQAKISALSSIDGLMGNIETSALTPAGNTMAAYAKSIGVTIDPNLSRKEAAQAIMNQLALESRSTAEGGGMPGAMSDKDREFLIGMNPNMGQTAQGRKLLIEVQKRSAKRTQQVAQWARDYYKMNGKFDEGFQDYSAAMAEKNPLFQDLTGMGLSTPGKARESSGRIGGASTLTPAEQAELDKLRRMLGK